MQIKSALTRLACCQIAPLRRLMGLTELRLLDLAAVGLALVATLFWES
jgi:hypothetical protein